MRLRELPTDPWIGTSTHKMLERFYIPALTSSITYDRGVGYFTSAWLRLAASGLSGLANNGGKARIVASPKLAAEDTAALAQGADARNDPLLRASLEHTLEELRQNLEIDTLKALAWMIADELLEFRVAIPVGELDGDFHDKFGVFKDVAGDAIAFHGSQNDSQKAFRNYESISIYYSWIDDRENNRVIGQQLRFNQLWKNEDANLRVYDLPDAVKRNLIEFTKESDRPYRKPVNPTKPVANDKRWTHQTDALACFLKEKHGILEMATGTGKTRTALAIANELIERNQIETIIVAAYGTDLLDQWQKELVKRVSLPLYRYYERYHEAQAYINDPEQSVLLISRQSLAEVLSKLQPGVVKKGLLICDEVHGLGSASLVATLAGRLKPFAYTLGLSATPEREYDPEGNQFIDDEIGRPIFKFGLKEAIEKGILCSFNYIDLEYQFSDDDRRAVQQAIARYHARVREGKPPSLDVLYQDISKVRKLSTNKLPPFRQYAAAHPETLKRCLIFVETAEYGYLVQQILMELHVDYHTYYGTDDRANLRRFADGQLECLITCHRISEGIDIQSVNNIVLFSAARAKLETVQRLGRCLRTDPQNPDKLATVVDFIRTDDIDDDDPTGEMTADTERREWLRELSKVRRI